MKRLIKKLVFTFVLLLSTPYISFAQGARYDNVAFRRLAGGNIMTAPNATIDVCTSAGAGQPCSPHALIFGDVALTQALGNPFTTDANGNYGFFATPGRYVVTVTGSGLSSYTNVVTLPCDPSASCTTSGTAAFAGAVLCKNWETIRCVDSANSAGWAGATPDAWIQAAINDANSAGGAPVFIAAGTYNIGTANPAISLKSNVKVSCANNQGTVLNYTGTGVAMAFGDGTTGVAYGGLENCQIKFSGAATGIQLSGSTSTQNFPNIYNTIRGNVINGQSGTGGTGILLLRTSWSNDYEFNIIFNVTTAIDVQMLNFSGENSTFLKNKISCNVANSTGLFIHPAAGPGDYIAIGNDFVGCTTGISLAGSTVYTPTIMSNHMEQHLTNILCNGVTQSGTIRNNSLLGTPSGILGASIRAIKLQGCQNLSIGPDFYQGTYSTDQINGDATSFANTFFNVDPNAATTVMANGANNVYISGTNGRVEVIGNTIRAYRGAANLTQYIELDSSSGIATLRCSVGIGSECDIAAGATTAAKFLNTGNQMLVPTSLSAITNAAGIQLFNTTTTCTTAATINTPCTTAAITLPVAYADTNYRLSCQGLGPTQFPQLQTVTKSNTTFTITLNNLTAAAASYSSFDCSAVHN